MREHFALAFALALALVLMGLRVRAFARSRRARARMRRARMGEEAARDLLVRRGYHVIDEQVAGALMLVVDGARSVHPLRADYIVTRHGKRYVAEVKTGGLAPSLDHAPTRRQIIEYCAAFDVDGALLVEPEAERVRAITLPARQNERLLLAMVLGGLLGAALMWFVR